MHKPDAHASYKVGDIQNHISGDWVIVKKTATKRGHYNYRLRELGKTIIRGGSVLQTLMTNYKNQKW